MSTNADVKMYPSIKSRILPGYKYTNAYPTFFNKGPLANSDLPANMLNVPISFKHANKGFLGIVKNQAVYNNGQNDGQDWKPATTNTDTKWIIRKSGAGYTVELATPKDGYKYLAAPSVCFTPLKNADAAQKDEPWPLGRTVADGSTAPYKYPVQGPEWSDTKFNNKGPCGGGKDCSRNGMFGTPKWWPTAQLIRGADVRYAVWNITYNRGTKAIAFSSARRPHNCGTRLDVFPVAKDAYWNLVRMTHAGAYFTAIFKPSTTPTRTPTAGPTDAPTDGPTEGPTDTPEPMPTSDPFTMPPLVIGGSTIGMDISNNSENTNNILNQAAQGGNGVDDTSALLLASLLAAQNGGAVGPEITPGGVLPYPNPYAMPLPEGTDAPTEAPVEAGPTAEEILAMLQTPAPTPAPTPFYSSPAFIIGSIVLVVAIAFAVWYFALRKKKGGASNGGNASNGGRSINNARASNGGNFGAGNGSASGNYGTNNSSAYANNGMTPATPNNA